MNTALKIQLAVCLFLTLAAQVHELIVKCMHSTNNPSANQHRLNNEPSALVI